MRKISLIILLVIIMSLSTACASLGFDNLNFNKSYVLVADIDGGNKNVTTARLTRTALDTWEGELVEPYALQGMKLAYSPTAMNISLDEFEVEHNGELNVSAFVMLNALECAFKKEGTTIKSSKKSIEITGISDGDAYILTLDKSGLPLTLEVPNKQLKVTFSDVMERNFN